MAGEYEPSSGNRTIWIVLAVLGGVFLAVIVVCGGIGFLLFRAAAPMIQQATQMVENTAKSMTTAQSFLDDLRNEQYDAAYQATTQAFQKRMSRKQLEELVKQFPNFQKHSTNPNELNPNTTDLKNWRFSYSFPGEGDQSVLVNLSVTSEDNVLKVDQFSMKKGSKVGPDRKSSKTPIPPVKPPKEPEPSKDDGGDKDEKP